MMFVKRTKLKTTDCINKNSIIYTYTKSDEATKKKGFENV